MNGENLLAGRTFTSTGGGTTNTFVFPNNLPGGDCSYYGCSPSPTAFARVLIATQGFAALGLVKADYVVPNGFLPLANGTINYAGVDQLTYMTLPTDGATALSRSGMTQANMATNFAGQSGAVSAVAPVSYEGLWWAAPAGAESGWGINFEHQGDVIFATWFTYDATGKGWWLVMTAQKSAPNTYTGTLLQTHGPAFNAVPFDPAQVTSTQVGTGTLTFSDANSGTLAYTVNGVSQMKSITRQVFGPLPTCGPAVNLAATSNYQGLWWAAPAGSESGWGVNFAHEGDTIFATWFTYDLDATPMWLVVTAGKTAPGMYTGTLYRTTGPAFSAVPFDSSHVAITPVGAATLTFVDGNTGTFSYTVNGVAQAKAITRQVFSGNGTICQ